jgi:predicted enzyme related to lactoylglutathione lyase
MNAKSILAAFAASAMLAACVTASGPDLTGMSFSDDPLRGKVVWNDLITEDLDAARNFYGDLFGWTFEDATGPGRSNYVLARSGNVYVAGLVPIATPADGSDVSRWLPYVSVEDVDASVSSSVAGGGKVAAAARNVNLGRVAAIVDAEGAVIGLANSKIGDPDDKTTAAGPGRIVWTELLSNDPAKAAAFYKAVTGLDAHTVQRRGGEYTILSADGVDRAGILQNPSSEWSPVWLTYFGVNDPATAADRAVSLGGKILLPVSADLRDGSMAVVTDPLGALLVLQKWSM